MNEKRAEVIVVGGGPVGLGLAIELGQRGVAVTVVEKYPQPQPVPKGQNLTQRTMEHMYAWGVETALREARTIPADYGIGGMTTYGTLIGEHRYDWLQRERVRPYYFTDNERLPQYATEAVLRRRAAELPSVTMLYGWEAEGVDQDTDLASVTIRQRDGSARRRLEAPWLVGCDGSRSVVRDGAGIGQIRSDHDRTMVLLVFRSAELDRLLQRYPGKSFYNVLDPALEGYWKFFGRVDLAGHFFFHAPVPRSAVDGDFDFAAYLAEAVGTPIDVEIEHAGFWDLRFAVADRYRQGRIFVAGDAAHSHPPYGGYGINTGFEDARNLGWKLAATLAGWGGPELLDSYDAERRPVFESTARDFIGRSIDEDRAFLAAHDPVRDAVDFRRAWAERAVGAGVEVASFAPRYGNSPIVLGQAGETTSARGHHDFIARAGYHLPPVTLSTGGPVHRTLGNAFTLLTFGADPSIVTAFVDAAKRHAIPLALVEEPEASEGDRYQAKAILVRPDLFVAWVGQDSNNAAAILETACCKY